MSTVLVAETVMDKTGDMSPFERFHEKEKSFWEQYALFFHAGNRAEPYQRTLAQIQRMLNIGQDESWLDIGCGSGEMISLLWRHTGGELSKIIGFDLSSRMIAITRRTVQTLLPDPHDKIAVFQHDLTQGLPVEANMLHGVIANFSLPYLGFYKDSSRDVLPRLFCDLRSILKPGGQLIWTTPRQGFSVRALFVASLKNILDFHHPSNLFFGPAIAFHIYHLQRMGARGLYNYPDEKAVIDLMERSGFQITVCEKCLADQGYLIKALKG